jgi:hypothetical protein
MRRRLRDSDVANIEDFAQQLFTGSRIDIRLKSPFCEVRQHSNGEMELGNGAVRMISTRTQIMGVLKQRDRDVEVEVSSVRLADLYGRGTMWDVG